MILYLRGIFQRAVRKSRSVVEGLGDLVEVIK